MVASVLFFIVLVVVIVWFAKSAGEAGGNQITWSLIGAASFGVPVLLVAEATKLFVKASGGMTQSAYTIMGAAAFIARISTMLPSRPIACHLISLRSASPETETSERFDSQFLQATASQALQPGRQPLSRAQLPN